MVLILRLITVNGPLDADPDPRKLGDPVTVAVPYVAPDFARAHSVCAAAGAPVTAAQACSAIADWPTRLGA